MEKRVRAFIPYLVLTVLTVAVYWRVLPAPFIFDDLGYMLADSVRAGDIPALLRHDRPLTWLTFAFNYRLGGGNPAGYHLFNLLLHCGAVLLLYRFARKILVLVGAGTAVAPLAFFCAALFALHPLQTETVSYAYNRAGALAALLCLAATLFYLASIERRGKAWYVLSAAAFLLAGLAKESAAVLPLLLFLTRHTFRRQLNVRRGAGSLLPFFAIAFGLVVLSQAAYAPPSSRDTLYRAQWTAWSYYYNQPRILVEFAGSFFLPVRLAIEHAVRPLPLTDLRVVGSFLLCGLAAAFVFRRSAGRTPAGRLAAFGAAWCLIALLPTSLAIVHWGERHLYFPGIGLSLCVTAFLLAILQARAQSAAARPALVLVLAAALPATLAWATVQRNELYRDPVLLWRDALRKYPRNATALNNLGVLHYDRREYAAAKECFERALAVSPSYADVHFNLALVHTALGDIPNAAAAHEAELRLQPNHVPALESLAYIYEDMNRPGQAIPLLERVVKVNPRHGIAFLHLGVQYAAMKRFAEAEQAYRSALGCDARNALFHNNLGALYLEQKRYDAAGAELLEALRINPGMWEALANMATLCREQRRYGEALAYIDKAVAANPGAEEARSERALCLAALKG